MSQSPLQPTKIDTSHPYAKATSQLNKLVRLGQSFSGHERNCVYLNERDGHFANASAVSGLDFAEDGRCIVRCDWDHDGDLDLWVSNRTAPRIRFLRNDFAAGNRPADDFVAFQLVGTKSNRDAIGARVLMRLATNHEASSKDSGDVLSQSVRCGEGFLGQSSSWLHFGLGKNTVEQLEVLWPTGTVERFEKPTPGGFYQLVEGSGEAKEWTPNRALPKTPAQLTNAASTDRPRETGVHHFLSQSVPLPPLVFTSFDDEVGDATQSDGKSTLLNLWASWCSPCVTELSNWSKNGEKLAAKQVRVIALSVDDLEQPDSRDDAPSRDLLKRIGFANTVHMSGMASPRLVELMQIVNNTVYVHDHRPLPVPTSFLIDSKGQLAAIYKGTVSINRVLKDVETIQTHQSQTEERMQASLPFPGQWIANQGPHDTGRLAAALWDAGFGREALSMASRTDLSRVKERIDIHWTNATRLRDEGKDPQSTVNELHAILELQPNHAPALMELGIYTARQGDLAKAAQLFEQAAENSNPPNSAAHFNLAKALFTLGKTDEAKTQLQQSVELDASQSQAHDMLGQLSVAKRDFKQAAKHFAAAWRANPANIPSLLNLTSALMETGNNSLALNELEAELRRSPDNAAVRVYLAQVLLGLNRTDDAIKELEDVLKHQPKASKVWFQLSQLETQRGNWAAAVSHLNRVAKLVPDDPIIKSELAWLYATVPDSKLRNGTAALDLAKAAADATQRREPRVLEILAAAYAETGDFQLAGQTLQQALKLLKPTNETNEKQIAILRLRWNATQDGKPHRISAPKREKGE